MTEFVVPDGVTAIGSYAFSGCAHLRCVYFPAGGLTAIGYNAFSGCTQLKDVILPDGLTRIEMNVFNRCSALTEVTIPASVTEVRGFSFMGCTALTDVYYTGTQAQWDAVRIDTSYGDPFKNAAVHVDAEQHVFGAWQTVEQPGCEQPGTISRTCTNGCGLKQTAAVPALGHDWDEGVVTTKPDGVLCGILHVTCKRCGAESDELLMPEIWAYEQFGDVDPTLWSYEGIQFCVMMGYMSGMDTHVFAPRGVTTRAQLVQILYNFVGGPEVSGETPFTDLTANWYKDAVLWAYQTGVSAGTSETTFAPDDPARAGRGAAVRVCRQGAGDRRSGDSGGSVPIPGRRSGLLLGARGDGRCCRARHHQRHQDRRSGLPCAAGQCDPRPDRHDVRGLLRKPRVN